MEFCEKCGSRLAPKKDSSDNQVSLMLVCNKCQYKKPKSEEKLIRSNGKIIEHGPKQYVAVIGKEAQLSTMPTVHIECTRCGNNTANVWQVQTRGSDESSTQFLRCTNCNYTFREST
ncbi:MAG: RPA12/RPB9/RPC11 RNA polymerase family protein [Candidatus Bathyarchaeota archaeon]|nr:RPA12/RPB9/RPC11 RNA polymerase family protein [Candidatus Termiticorpusculum sp.]